MMQIVMLRKSLNHQERQQVLNVHQRVTQIVSVMLSSSLPLTLPSIPTSTGTFRDTLSSSHSSDEEPVHSSRFPIASQVIPDPVLGVFSQGQLLEHLTLARPILIDAHDRAPDLERLTFFKQLLQDSDKAVSNFCVNCIFS